MLELKDDNGKLLPKEVQKRVNDFIEHSKEINWFRPSKDLKKSEVDKQAKFVLKCFGIEAKIEYRKLDTNEDWNCAWKSASDLAYDSDWDSARKIAWESAYNLAWISAHKLAWNSIRISVGIPAYDSAWISTRILVGILAWTAVELLIIDNKDFKEKYPNGAFTQLFKLWEMGLYPVGVLEENKKFVIYVDPKYCLKENGRFE